MASVEADPELWEDARRGATDALGTLFDRHANAVYRYCRLRMESWADAEDLTVAVFMEAWRGRDRLTLSGVSAIPLLFGIARNLCAHYHRDRHRARLAWQRIAAQPSFTAANDELVDRLDRARQIPLLAAAMASLSPEHRDVVELCLIGEMSTADAAAALDIPIGTVKSRLSRARAQLQVRCSPGASGTYKEER